MNIEKEALIMSEIRSIKEDGRKQMEVLNSLRVDVGIIASKVEDLNDSASKIAVLENHTRQNKEDHIALRSMIKENSVKIEAQETKLWRIIVFAAAAGFGTSFLGTKFLDLIK